VEATVERIDTLRIYLGLEIDPETESRLWSEIYNEVLTLSKAQEQLRKVNSILPWDFEVPRQCLSINKGLRIIAKAQIIGIDLHVDLVSGAGPMASKELDKWLELTRDGIAELTCDWVYAYGVEDTYEIVCGYLPNCSDALLNVFAQSTQAV
jgi:hypothetical protein